MRPARPMNMYKQESHALYSKILGGCPFNGPLSGTKYPTRAASPIKNASTPKSSLPFSKHNNNNNNNGRNGSCLTWLATSLEEKRRWLVINASPRGQCSK